MKTRAQIPDLCSKLGVPCYNCHLMARVLRRKCELLVQGKTLPKGIVTEWEDKPQCVLVTSASMHRHMQADNRQYTHINLSLWTTSAHTLMLWWTIATSTTRTTENLPLPQWQVYKSWSQSPSAGWRVYRWRSQSPSAGWQLHRWQFQSLSAGWQVHR